MISGGPDSCVLLAEMAKRFHRVFPVFVRQGLVWETSELRHLRHFLRDAHITHEPLTILHLSVRDLYGKHWSTTGQHVPGSKTRDEAVFLPGRNLLLLAKAAVFCALHEIPVIAVGSLGHNPFSDATPQFFRAFSLAARVRVIAPFRRLSKKQVMRRGQHLPLHLSFSCLSPVRGRHCGHCNKCAERLNAFSAAGMSDATKYAT